MRKHFRNIMDKDCSSNEGEDFTKLSFCGNVSAYSRQKWIARIFSRQLIVSARL